MLSKKIGMLFTFLDSALLPQLSNGLYGEGGDGMSDERTVSADYESMYKNAIHHLEAREKELKEAMARADYFEREKERESHYMRGMIDGLKFAIRCNGVSGAEVQ